ncbi:MAG: LysM peptidoglycan-binding domain-containing protein, partial [Treponema sp.]|nr:LysM peptidoglycan-binding domain-containing protein [Treponema sp.]
MRCVKTLFQDICKTCLEHKQAVVVRFVVALCVCGVLVLHLSSSFAGPESVSAGQMQELDAAEGGVGGGSYLEKAIAGEGLEAGWSLDAGVLEPESFSKPKMLLYSAYTIQKGDIIGELAAAFGLNEDTLISINGIKNTRLIQIGQVLRVPNQDGILYMVKHGDTLDHIAQKYSAEAEAIQIANELFSDALPGSALFIPGARLDWMERQEINGDLFIWP